MKRMRILLTGAALSALILITGCIEHRPEDYTVTVTETDSVKPKLNGRELKGLRVYEGIIPCGDCSGIYQRLALKGDSLGIFRLTETYRDATEDGDGVVVTTGSWKRYTVGKDKQAKTLYYLSEGSFSDSSRIQRYEVFGNRIVQLDLNGVAVDSTRNYTLKLISRN
jgi:copper homeostasis protein (lipoprotein)